MTVDTKALFDAVRTVKGSPLTQEDVNLINTVLGASVGPATASGAFVVDPQLIEDLKRDEGCRLAAYPDPLSGGDPWTIGFGSTGPDIKKGTVWTQTQAEEALRRMACEHAAELERKAPWVANLDKVRRRVLHNMAYNLGVDGLLKFKNTLSFVQLGQWDKAADGMMASLWAQQVGQRAVRLAKQMRTGV